jgi:hypothetical protein
MNSRFLRGWYAMLLSSVASGRKSTNAGKAIARRRRLQIPRGRWPSPNVPPLAAGQGTRAIGDLKFSQVNPGIPSGRGSWHSTMIHRPDTVSAAAGDVPATLPITGSAFGLVGRIRRFRHSETEVDDRVRSYFCGSFLPRTECHPVRRAKN